MTVRLLVGSPEARAVVGLMSGEPIVNLPPSRSLTQDEQVATVLAYLWQQRESVVTILRVGLGAAKRAAESIARQSTVSGLPAWAMRKGRGVYAVWTDADRGERLMVDVVGPRDAYLLSGAHIIVVSSEHVRRLPRRCQFAQVLVTGSESFAPSGLRQFAGGPINPDFWPDIPLDAILAGVPS